MARTKQTARASKGKMPQKNIKLVVVGDHSSGKTALLITYTTNAFPTDYIPTVFDNYSANVIVAGNNISLGLWDTAGQEDYDRLRPLSYPNTDVFVVTTSVQSLEGLNSIKDKWIPELRHHCHGVPILIVGTCCDARDKKVEDGESPKPFISKKDFELCVNLTGAYGYMECSALTGHNVSDVFNQAIRAALKLPFAPNAPTASNEAETELEKDRELLDSVDVKSYEADWLLYKRDGIILDDSLYPNDFASRIRLRENGCYALDGWEDVIQRIGLGEVAPNNTQKKEAKKEFDERKRELDSEYEGDDDEEEEYDDEGVKKKVANPDIVSHLHFVTNPYLTDLCLYKFYQMKERFKLETVLIMNCPNITDDGIYWLHRLMQEGRDKDDIIKVRLDACPNITGKSAALFSHDETTMSVFNFTTITYANTATEREKRFKPKGRATINEKIKVQQIDSDEEFTFPIVVVPKNETESAQVTEVMKALCDNTNVPDEVGERSHLFQTGKREINDKQWKFMIFNPFKDGFDNVLPRIVSLVVIPVDLTQDSMISKRHIMQTVLFFISKHGYSKSDGSHYTGCRFLVIGTSATASIDQLDTIVQDCVGELQEQATFGAEGLKSKMHMTLQDEKQLGMLYLLEAVAKQLCNSMKMENPVDRPIYTHLYKDQDLLLAALGSQLKAISPGVRHLYSGEDSSDMMDDIDDESNAKFLDIANLLSIEIEDATSFCMQKYPILDNTLQVLHDEGDVLYFRNLEQPVVLRDFTWYSKILKLITSENSCTTPSKRLQTPCLPPGTPVWSVEQLVKAIDTLNDPKDQGVEEFVQLVSEKLIPLLEHQGLLVRLPCLRTQLDEEKYVFVHVPSIEKPEAPLMPATPDAEVPREIVTKVYNFNCDISQGLIQQIAAVCSRFAKFVVLAKEGMLIHQGGAEVLIKTVTNDGCSKMTLQSSTVSYNRESALVSGSEKVYKFVCSVFYLYADVIDHVIQTHYGPFVAMITQPSTLPHNHSICYNHNWQVFNGNPSFRSICTLCGHCMIAGMDCPYDGILQEYTQRCGCTGEIIGCLDCGICTSCASYFWKIKSYLRPGYCSSDIITESTREFPISDFGSTDSEDEDEFNIHSMMLDVPLDPYLNNKASILIQRAQLSVPFLTSENHNISIYLDGTAFTGSDVVYQLIGSSDNLDDHDANSELDNLNGMLNIKLSDPAAHSPKEHMPAPIMGPFGVYEYRYCWATEIWPEKAVLCHSPEVYTEDEYKNGSKNPGLYMAKTPLFSVNEGKNSQKDGKIKEFSLEILVDERNSVLIGLAPADVAFWDINHDKRRHVYMWNPIAGNENNHPEVKRETDVYDSDDEDDFEGDEDNEDEDYGEDEDLQEILNDIQAEDEEDNLQSSTQAVPNVQPQRTRGYMHAAPRQQLATRAARPPVPRDGAISVGLLEESNRLDDLPDLQLNNDPALSNVNVLSTNLQARTLTTNTNANANDNLLRSALFPDANTSKEDAQNNQANFLEELKKNVPVFDPDVKAGLKVKSAKEKKIKPRGVKDSIRVVVTRGKGKDEDKITIQMYVNGVLDKQNNEKTFCDVPSELELFAAVSLGADNIVKLGSDSVWWGKTEATFTDTSYKANGLHISGMDNNNIDLEVQRKLLFHNVSESPQLIHVKCSNFSDETYITQLIVLPDGYESVGLMHIDDSDEPIDIEVAWCETDLKQIKSVKAFDAKLDTAKEKNDLHQVKFKGLLENNQHKRMIRQLDLKSEKGNETFYLFNMKNLKPNQTYWPRHIFQDCYLLDMCTYSQENDQLVHHIFYIPRLSYKLVLETNTSSVLDFLPDSKFFQCPLLPTASPRPYTPARGSYVGINKVEQGAVSRLFQNKNFKESKQRKGLAKERFDEFVEKVHLDLEIEPEQEQEVETRFTDSEDEWLMLPILNIENRQGSFEDVGKDMNVVSFKQKLSQENVLTPGWHELAIACMTPSATEKRLAKIRERNVSELCPDLALEKKLIEKQIHLTCENQVKSWTAQKIDLLALWVERTCQVLLTSNPAEARELAKDINDAISVQSSNPRLATKKVAKTKSKAPSKLSNNSQNETSSIAAILDALKAIKAPQSMIERTRENLSHATQTGHLFLDAYKKLLDALITSRSYAQNYSTCVHWPYSVTVHSRYIGAPSEHYKEATTKSNFKMYFPLPSSIHISDMTLPSIDKIYDAGNILLHRICSLEESSDAIFKNRTPEGVLYRQSHILYQKGTPIEGGLPDKTLVYHEYNRLIRLDIALMTKLRLPNFEGILGLQDGCGVDQAVVETLMTRFLLFYLKSSYFYDSTNRGKKHKWKPILSKVDVPMCQTKIHVSEKYENEKGGHVGISVIDLEAIPDKSMPHNLTIKIPDPSTLLDLSLFTNLVSLRLDLAEDRRIDGEWTIPDFSRCPKLSDLSVRFNGTCFSEEHTRKLGIKILEIAKTYIETLPDHLFSPAIQQVKVAQSPLRCVPQSLCVVNLTKLRLEGTMVSSLPPELALAQNLIMLKIGGIPWYETKGLYEDVKIPKEKFLEDPNMSGIQFIQRLLPQSTIDELFDKYDIDSNKMLDRRELANLNADLFWTIPRLGCSMKDAASGGFPEVICSLKKLEFLELTHTTIRHLPASVERLTNLKKLLLQNNPLFESLPPELGNLSLDACFLSHCPSLKTPPHEVISHGTGPTNAYMKRLIKGSTECRRTKLMLVGLGGAGKTSLLKALMSSQNKTVETKGEEITDGIDIQNWTVMYDDGLGVTFSVWDFAGQTIYYNTHQFFLSQRAVYLLLWTTRLGHEHAGLDFWLSSITSHAPDTPIFIVGTHIDQVAKAEIPMDKLKKRYPQIVGFHFVSSVKGTGISKLKDDLMTETMKQPYMGEKIPQAWLDLEKEMIRLSKEKTVITWNAMEELNLGTKCGIYEHDDMKEAITFLTFLGTVQYFDNDYLRDCIVIDPQWIVDAMSCVVSVKQSPIKNGRFQHRDLKRVWPETLLKNAIHSKGKGQKKINMHEWLLRLTEEFDLTFPLPDEPVSIVPCLLSEQEPKFEWPPKDEVPGTREMKMVYQFTYLPTGLFNRVQVRLFQFSNKAAIWKRGSILNKNNHTALITHDKDLSVIVRGPQPENVLFLIHEVLEGLIAESFQGVDYTFQIPCPDCMNKVGTKDPSMFDHHLVHMAVDVKAPFLQCRKYFHSISMAELQAVMPPSNAVEFNINLEQTIRQLQDVHRDMSADIFFCYCQANAPPGDDSVVQPEKVKVDLENLGYKCWYREDMGLWSFNDLVVPIKDAKMALVFMSDEFAADAKCQELYHYIKLTLKKPCQIIAVGASYDWKQTPAGLLVGEEVFVNMRQLERYEAKLEELKQAVTQTLNQTANEDLHPPCFISYCWANSSQAVKLGTKAKDGSVGWGDPRDMKDMLEKNGIDCWIDIEQTGQNDLFESISNGLRHSKVVVVCVSEQYADSTNCMMELRFAACALNKPIIVAIVGNSNNWRYTEAAMLTGRGKSDEINFQEKSETAFDKLLEKVKTIIDVEKHKESEKAKYAGKERPSRPTSAASQRCKTDENDSGCFKTNDTEVSYQEVYELAQRKFMRLLEVLQHKGEIKHAIYPRLCVLDLMEADKDGTTEKQTYCFRILCEYENGWHICGNAIPYTGDESSATALIDKSTAYLGRLLTILKYSNVGLQFFTTGEENEQLAKRIQKNAMRGMEGSDIGQAYNVLRDELIFHDEESVKGNLSRCHLPTGKIHWLCADHQQGSRITVLSDTTIADVQTEVVNAHDFLLKEYVEKHPKYAKFLNDTNMEKIRRGIHLKRAPTVLSMTSPTGTSPNGQSETDSNNQPLRSRSPLMPEGTEDKSKKLRVAGIAAATVNPAASRGSGQKPSSQACVIL
ncbi:unnamed protein product [Owenia fusiformis]|uniref:non-specific serine/threonine protein kinase n=1 Tax=Owenia fusiformis TaxID=6347 RepID=A0A8J1UXG3_OWEFU|nr:unnamed protein product [Owenia fusiformis]